MPPHSATRLVVVGQGYVGLPLAMRAVEAGFDVVGFDLDEARIKRLAAGESFVEDVADTRLQEALRSGRYHPTSEPGRCAGFDVAVIDVPTPLHDGNPNLAHVEAAAAMLAQHLRPGATVILESPPRTPAPPRNWWPPSWKTARGWARGPTSTWATAPSASTPGTPPGAWPTPRRSSRA